MRARSRYLTCVATSAAWGVRRVERHGQRIAAEILLHGAPHVVAAQRIELFACHAGKVTDFSATDGMPRG